PRLPRERVPQAPSARDREHRLRPLCNNGAERGDQIVEALDGLQPPDRQHEGAGKAAEYLGPDRFPYIRGNGVGQGYRIRHDVEGQLPESPAVRAGDGRSDRDDACGAPPQHDRLDELALALEAPDLPRGVME